MNVMQTSAAPRLLGHRRLSRRSGLRIIHIRHAKWLRAAVGPAIGIAAVVALVLAIDPASFGRSIEHFNAVLVPAIVAVSISYYVVQGVRWYFLLVDVGVHIRLRDVVLLTLAGQSTALLPLGELTRSVFVAQVSGAEFGGVVAAETVQELLYTVTLIIFAIPGLLILPNAIGGIVVILAGITFVMVAMSWCRVYRYLRWMVARTPLLRRALHEVDELHNDLVVLLRKPGTLGWLWLSGLQAVAMITVLWLVADAIAPGALDWKEAALVFAVSNVAGLLSLIPGGLGAYEGSIIGLLIGFGVHPGAAAAIAIVQRLAGQGIATGVGFAAYAVAHRTLGISGLGSVTIQGSPQPRPQPAAASVGAAEATMASGTR